MSPNGFPHTQQNEDFGISKWNVRYSHSHVEFTVDARTEQVLEAGGYDASYEREVER